jgi:hypothetical protein
MIREREGEEEAYKRVERKGEKGGRKGGREKREGEGKRGGRRKETHYELQGVYLFLF